VNLDLTALPVDVDALHRLVRELAAQVADDDAQLAAARAEVERLRLIIRGLAAVASLRRSAMPSPAGQLSAASCMMHRSASILRIPRVVSKMKLI
jgi:transposase